MRVLVVTTEPVPLPGLATTGAGLRAWGLAQGLRASGFEVEIASAADALSNVPPERLRETGALTFPRERLTEFVVERAPDAILMQHWGLMNRLGPVACPLAVDLAGPHLIERRFWKSPHPERDLEDKLAALSRADFLTCSGRVQRNYFLAFAAVAGFDPSDPALLPVIPFSFSPDLPPEREFDAEAFVYSGIFLPWQNPSAAIDAALAAFAEANRGRLRFIGAPHPAGDVSGGAFEPVLQRLQASDRVSIEAPRPFENLLETLAACGCALDLMARNAERELAFTSRTVVYLACGLPVLYNDYSELSGLIADYDAGWTLDPDDDAAIRETVLQILRNPEEINSRRSNARRLVRERLDWTKTVSPLAEWCATPRTREKASVPDAARAGDLRRRLAELEGRRLVKLSNRLRRRRRMP